MKSILALLWGLLLLFPHLLAAQSEIVEEIPLDDFPHYTQGYTIQIGAFGTENAAQALKRSLLQKVEEKIHLRYAENLYRVRVGDFVDSISAVKFLKNTSALSSYTQAQIVSDRIKVDRDKMESRDKIGGFRVQVRALTDREKALELGRKLDFKFVDVRAYVLRDDSVYKVQLGDFSRRVDAESFIKELEDIEEMETWVVPTRVYLNPPPSPVERPDSDPFDYTD